MKFLHESLSSTENQTSSKEFLKFLLPLQVGFFFFFAKESNVSIPVLNTCVWIHRIKKRLHHDILLQEFMESPSNQTLAKDLIRNDSKGLLIVRKIARYVSAEKVYTKYLWNNLKMNSSGKSSKNTANKLGRDSTTYSREILPRNLIYIPLNFYLQILQGISSTIMSWLISQIIPVGEKHKFSTQH